MPHFFMNKRLIILLVGIILLVALIGFSIRDRDNLTWPEQFVKDTAGFVQTIFAKPAAFVAGFADNVKDLLDTYEENKVLKSRLDDYARLRVEADRLRKENDELKSILDKEKDLASFNTRHASVISRNLDRWDESIIINKGEVHGIEKNMAVITADGMIGKIQSTGALTSKVQLLTTMDRTNRIHAIVQAEEDIFGLIEGYDYETKWLLLKQIPAGMEVQVGLDVVTSGLGGVFPKGLYIGKVEKVEPDQFGLTQTAYIKPAANFYNLQEVIVVERMMELPDIEEGPVDES